MADDAAGFQALVRAMKTLGQFRHAACCAQCLLTPVLVLRPGISDDVMNDLWMTLAAILQLGCIDMVTAAQAEPQSETGTTVPAAATQAEVQRASHGAFADASYVQYAATLLGVRPAELSEALLASATTSVTNAADNARRRDSAPEGPDAATVRATLVSLARSLYERLFGALVGIVNRAVEARSVIKHTLYALDCAGFRSTVTGAFGRLCANAISDRVQQVRSALLVASSRAAPVVLTRAGGQFVGSLWAQQEQDEYAQQKIAWTHLSLARDLQPILDDLLKAPYGVLALLDDEAAVPDGSDDAFMRKLGVRSNSATTDERPSVRCAAAAPFSVTHYAGTVEYCATDMVERNRNVLGHTLVQLLSRSHRPFIASLFQSTAAVVPNFIPSLKRAKLNAARPKCASVCANGMHTMDGVLELLRRCRVRVVYCVAANERHQPALFDDAHVRHQLHALDVLASVRLYRQGYPDAMGLGDFRRHFASLAPPDTLPQPVLDEAKAAQALAHALDLEPASYALGVGKIFMRAGVLASLERQLVELLAPMLVRLQAQSRGYLARRQCEVQRQRMLAISVIQKNVRKLVAVRAWSWWRLFVRVKRLGSPGICERDLKQRDAEAGKLHERLAKLTKVIAWPAFPLRSAHRLCSLPDDAGCRDVCC